ncbi:NADH-quinone oxidoreductase subunit D [Egicoccus sp. AB-alg2]|uniref:NADH-quinone oxidoreductase subunit D n=1 Tax=Egicoccus sp. AB-alg2 TaxID=3242693 RepID=UPI00359CDA03
MPAAGTRVDDPNELFVEGADWETVVDAIEDDTLTVNMGPQHPSTHGVLRLVLELDGETVLRVAPIIGYLHTGIEKNAEYRTWVQGSTFVTRMDYVAPLFNEWVYCMGVEKLLDVQVPERADAVRVILSEFNRISSHLVWLATGGMELGATTVMTNGFGAREHILDLFESQSGLRMNHAYFRPGGLAQDVTEDFVERCESLLEYLPGKIGELEDLLTRNPIFNDRLRGIGVLTAEDALAFGVTGPLLRAAGVPHDLRKASPYAGYDQYDFEVPTETAGDSFARYLVRVEEMRQSLRIIRQALDTLPGGEVMVADKKIRWPSQQALGPDGIGNDPEYIRHIMGESMESLINHFKLVTQGFTVPAGQVYTTVESPRGELGCALTSNGTNKPYRVHLRDPSFVGLQAMDDMSRGHAISDVIVVVASLDPIMGGVDR